MVKNEQASASPATARHSQRLAGAGRADEQHAARDAAAELLELLRVAQKLDDLLQILLGLVDAGDILEGHTALRLLKQLGLRLAESHRLAGAALHLARHVDPHAEEQHQRQAVDPAGSKSHELPSEGGRAVIVTSFFIEDIEQEPDRWEA